MKIGISTLLFILTLSAIAALGQAPSPTPTVPRTVAGGVINGKAVNLVKPSYPAAARAVGAEGTVQVQVTIDEEGKVISASAVSGHPLLRAASVEAAQASTFAPTLLSGQAVKVTGVIVYNFVGPKAPPEQSAFRLGTIIGGLDQTAWPMRFSAMRAGTYFHADWNSERAALERLQATFDKIPGEGKPAPAVVAGSPSGGNGTGVAVTTFSTIEALPKTPTPDASDQARALYQMIEQRFSASPVALWSFGAGRAFALAMSGTRARSLDMLARASNELRTAAATMPSDGTIKVTREELEKAADVLLRFDTATEGERGFVAELYGRLGSSGPTVRQVPNE